MTKEKIKNSLKSIWDNISLFLWMLIPSTPMISTIAFVFLETSSVWFWVLSLAPIVPIIITRPSINSCSQWENSYILSIGAALGVLVVRLCGLFPI